MLTTDGREERSLDNELALLLERWESATDGGRTATVEDVCSDRPDLAAAFRRLLNQLGLVNAVMETLPSAAEAAPEAIDAGRFRPLRFHARGGLGVVYAAEDTEVRRGVALKWMRADAGLDDAARDRFLLEAELTGRLEHPGVVPVYGLGTDPHGRPYYAMRFIEGTTLTDAIAAYHARPADNVAFRRLLRHFVAVCETMAFAHSRGVIHRDLKPANIMLGPFGETLVVDWGLAKKLVPDATGMTLDSANGAPGHRRQFESEATIAGCAKGTPAFMPPEQAAGDWPNVGPAADVYSLGATLYAILTGRKPFDGDSAREVIEKVKAGRFAPPRAVNPSVPKPLEAVCLKAMGLRQADRYAGAKELAADVERWLADEPVTAWREPFALRARRRLRRHRTLVSTSVAALAVGAALLAVLGARLEGKNRELDRRNEELVALNDKEGQARARAELHLRRNVGQLEGMLRFALASRAMEAARRDPVYLALLDQLEGHLADLGRDAPDDVQAHRVNGLTLYLRAASDPTAAGGRLARARAEFAAILNRDAADAFASWGLAAVRLEEARRLAEGGNDAAALAAATEAADGLLARVKDDKAGTLHGLALAGCCALLGELWERSPRPEPAALLARVDAALRWLNARPRQLNPEAFARVMTQSALGDGAAGFDPYWRAYLTGLLQHERGRLLDRGLNRLPDAIDAWTEALRAIEQAPPADGTGAEVPLLAARVRLDLGLASRRQSRPDLAWRYLLSACNADFSSARAAERRPAQELVARVESALIETGLEYLEKLRPNDPADRATAGEVAEETRTALERWKKVPPMRGAGKDHKEQVEAWRKRLDKLARSHGTGPE
jgi:hypothetical protein